MIKQAETREEQAKTRGVTEGQAAILLRQLRRRFQDLPTWIEEKVAAADLQQLERWSDRILDAESLVDLFDS
ncbi:MAG: DUF4351 domain-containing protein [Magnetococcales bacterium]|nr:DUF4351 domain-containing protein [Magnetococcales bacterium]